MIRYSKGEKVIFEKDKKVKTSVVCDKCGKEIICKDRPGHLDWNLQRYFSVTTGHNDWGNDSCESVEHFEICPNCISTFVADYFESNKDSGTAYAMIESDIAYPSVKYEEYEKKMEDVK